MRRYAWEVFGRVLPYGGPREAGRLLIEQEGIYSSHPELAFHCHSFLLNDEFP